MRCSRSRVDSARVAGGAAPELADATGGGDTDSAGSREPSGGPAARRWHDGAAARPPPDARALGVFSEVQDGRRAFGGDRLGRLRCAVGGWIDGTAYRDQSPSAAWPVPLSVAYPDAARNGGFASPRYARLVAAYLTECRKHFEERGWIDRAFLRITLPSPLTPDLVEQTRRFMGIVKQSGIAFPTVWHLPAGSSPAPGWYNAPPVDLPDTGVWCPPASWWAPTSWRPSAAWANERGSCRSAAVQPDPCRPSADGRCLCPAVAGVSVRTGRRVASKAPRMSVRPASIRRAAAHAGR